MKRIKEIRSKGEGEFVATRCMKAWEEWMYSSVHYELLDRNKSSASRSSQFTPGKEPSGLTEQETGWVGPKASLDPL